MSVISADVEKVIAIGLRELGQHESPSKSNRQKYGAWYGMNAAPWCAMFVSWVFWHAGYGFAITTSNGFAYVEAGRQWAIKNGCWHSGKSGIKRGDIIVYSFGGSRGDHTGIALSGVGRDGRVHTLEGNTNSAGGRTGGIVMEKYRSSNIMGYISVSPKTSSGPAAPPTPDAIDWAAVRRMVAAQQADTLSGQGTITSGSNWMVVCLIQNVINTIAPERKLVVDGVWNPNTDLAVKDFQRILGLTPDGVIGDSTRWWMVTTLRRIQAGG